MIDSLCIHVVLSRFYSAKVAGGTSIIHKTLVAFLPPSVTTVLVLDMHAYDGFPALAALEACVQ